MTIASLSSRVAILCARATRSDATLRMLRGNTGSIVGEDGETPIAPADRSDASKTRLSLELNRTSVDDGIAFTDAARRACA